MKFRKAGRLAKIDKFYLHRNKIEVCNSYSYLGVLLQPSLVFSKHVKNRKASAAAATGSLNKLRLVSVDTAMKIFNMKIKPIFLYGWTSISSFLTVSHLIEADRVKTLFLKKALGIHKISSATMSLKLCDTVNLAEELINDDKLIFDKKVVQEYKSMIKERNKNYETSLFPVGPAFIDTKWKMANQKNRHCFTRVTAHGFHHKLCIYNTFHKAPLDEFTDSECLCKFCGESFSGGLYHILSCPFFTEMTLLEKIHKIDDSI